MSEALIPDGRWMKARSDGKVWSSASSSNSSSGKKYLNESSWNGKMTWSIRLFSVQPSFSTDKQTNVSLYHQSNEHPIVSMCNFCPKDYYSFFVDLMRKCAISSDDSAHSHCVLWCRAFDLSTPSVYYLHEQWDNMKRRVLESQNKTFQMNPSRMVFSQNLESKKILHMQ